MVESDARQSAAERAYRRLRDDILDGSLATGTMLGESGLADRLGMSRTPVRAALTRLQEEGWITIYPKRGALVRGLDERTIRELADVRCLLESTAVRRAPAALRAGLADRLEAQLDEQRAAFDGGDRRLLIEEMLRFHRGFVEAGGSAVMLELYDRLSDRQRFALFAEGDLLRARRDEVLAQHRLLVDQLRGGEADAFAATLRGHISEVGASTR